MDTTDSDSLVLNKKLQYLKMKASVSIYGAIACCFDLLCSGFDFDQRIKKDCFDDYFGHVLFLSVLP